MKNTFRTYYYYHPGKAAWIAVIEFQDSPDVIIASFQDKDQAYKWLVNYQTYSHHVMDILEYIYQEGLPGYE